MQEREERRFERIFMPHLGAGYNLARWLTRNDHDAQDVVQEAYLRALRKYQNDLQEGCERHRCDYVLMNTGRPLAETLTAYLARRLRLRLV